MHRRGKGTPVCTSRPAQLMIMKRGCAICGVPRLRGRAVGPMAGAEACFDACGQEPAHCAAGVGALQSSSPLAMPTGPASEHDGTRATKAPPPSPPGAT